MTADQKEEDFLKYISFVKANLCNVLKKSYVVADISLVLEGLEGRKTGNSKWKRNELSEKEKLAVEGKILAALDCLEWAGSGNFLSSEGFMKAQGWGLGLAVILKPPVKTRLSKERLIRTDTGEEVMFMFALDDHVARLSNTK